MESVTVTAGDRPSHAVDAGSLDDLRRQGRLLTKVGEIPVLVVWHDERPYAIEDRCPHMGFPLHRGTVEAGLLTCHWHHARFDLSSGCTLDLFADDARAFDVDVADGRVLVAASVRDQSVAALDQRLRDGLEEGLDLVVAKAVLGLLDAGVPVGHIVAAGLEFGAANRSAGWGAGMTVLVAVANLAPHLRDEDVALALVHGLSFVSSDTRGQPPRFPLQPLAGGAHDAGRLAAWFRRFADTRSADAAERVLATALGAGDHAGAEEALFAAITDHVFVDEGHTLDFANKAVEGLDHVGGAAAAVLLPTLVRPLTAASRAEETAAWRHPDDLAGLYRAAADRLPHALAEGARRTRPFDDAEALAWAILGDHPADVVAAVEESIRQGAPPEVLGRAVAYAAALRITRFHVQNDFADWNSVHHAFTTANALHQALLRRPTPDLVRAVFQNALRIHLDRFLNVPPARLPAAEHARLEDLPSCWDVQGEVDRAGEIVAGHLRSGGTAPAVVAQLGRALLQEDAGFHWYQVVEAGVRQASAWPAGGEPPVLILAGVARFLAAHTPTRRQLSTVVHLARRLRRGDHLHEDLPASP